MSAPPPVEIDRLGVDDIFTQQARSSPDRQFLVHRALVLTYAQTDELVARCAAALAAVGVSHGDRVAILCATRPEATIVFLACARLGAVYLGLGTRVHARELTFVCEDASPSFIFSLREFEGRQYSDDVLAAAAAAGMPQPVLMTVGKDGSLAPEFSAFLDSTASVPLAQIDSSDAVAIIYTSGTTGRPKGAVISHRGLINIRHLFTIAPADQPRLLSVMPIDHIGYLGNELMAALLTGGTLVQLPRFDARDVAETIQAHRVTIWQGAIPTMLTRLVALDDLDSFDLSSLQRVWWAGQLPERVGAKILEFADEVGASYGMTELASITMTRPSDPLGVHIGTVGVPLADIEVRLEPLPSSSDSSSGAAASQEVFLRRTGMFLGYWNRPVETAEAVDDDGWFRTGDLGHWDGDGNLVIDGRSKLLVRSGGYNLSPFEIEIALESHPGVAMAIVVGVPDDEFGEAAHVSWVAASGSRVVEKDLRAHLQERLASYKIPKVFHEYRDLPLLANGKANRVQIRTSIVSPSSAPR